MANLRKSTHQADTAREACTCVRECRPGCHRDGSWHAHTSDACAVHPDNLVQ